MSDICQPANVITEYPSEPVQFMVHGNWKGIWGEQPSLVSRNSGESSLLLLSFPSFLFWLFFYFYFLFYFLSHKHQYWASTWSSVFQIKLGAFRLNNL